MGCGAADSSRRLLQPHLPSNAIRRHGVLSAGHGWAAGTPSGGESGNVLVGFVELCDGPGSGELFGCDVEAIGVALNGLEKPGFWIGELPQHSAGGEWSFIAGEDLLRRLGQGGLGNRLGSDEAVGVAVADDLEVEVVGVPAAGEHGVELLPGFLPGQHAVHRVGGDGLGRRGWWRRNRVRLTS
jgi:hypothetical protein